MEVKLEKRFELTRDLFLFCIFTGLSFCDMRKPTTEILIIKSVEQIPTAETVRGI